MKSRKKILTTLAIMGLSYLGLNYYISHHQQPGGEKFYQTLQVPEAPSLTPTQALAAFSIAPEFSIELVAAEPLVEDPVAMAWDENGDLYVVEMRGFMPDAYGTGAELPVGRVVRLRDNNGDGVMDQSRIFLDQLVLPRAIAVVNEGVLIGEPPTLWLCKNNSFENGCGEKIKLGSFGDLDGEANVEHIENGLLMGLDNWLYNAKSDRRLRIADGKLEQQDSVFRGQWGIAKDNQGRLFYNTNSNFLSGDLFPGEAFVGERGILGLNQQLTQTDEVFSVRVNPGVNRAYIDGILRPDGRLKAPTAVSGLAVYTGSQFPASFQHDVFVPEPGANVVAQLRLHEDGISLSAEHITYPDPQWGQREFLASTDERFRPVDAKVGPDGALYIIDMYRGIIQDGAFLTDELRQQIFDRHLDKPLGHGRIWRITHNSGKPLTAPANLADASTETLLALLAHPNSWQRDTAQRLLQNRGDLAPEQLVAIIENGSGLAATHALWTLHGREQLQPAHVLAALDRNNPELAVQALRAGGQLLSLPQLLAVNASALKASDTLQQQLILSLGKYHYEMAAQQALKHNLEQHIDSEYIRQATARAVQDSGFSFLQQLLADPAWQTQTDAGYDFLSALTQVAYRDIRTNNSDPQAVANTLLSLTALLSGNSGPQQWRQSAMLDGLYKASRAPGFEPAMLPAVPPLFADNSIKESNPLWEQRLKGRRAFTWPGDEIAAGIIPLTPAQQALKDQGEILYSGCSNCHGKDGEGVVGLAPTLADSSWIAGPPEWLGRIILQGLSGPIIVNGVEWNGVMPAHQNQPGFDDEGVAGLMTFLRRSWGNNADPVSPEQVQKLRSASRDRKAAWTAAELQEVAFESPLDRYVGEYKLSFITFKVYKKGNGLALNIPMYGDGPLTHVSGSTYRGGNDSSSIEISFIEMADGSVPGFTLVRDGQEMEALRQD